MDQIRDKNRESAQGMVEFALVLPILLLVILGIFAFGHMFFAYTSIVSASREAARFGAVVGVSGSGTLRYRDCAGIRDSAENIGKYVGVEAVETTDGFEGDDPGIFIGYDGGPNTSVYDTCPEGGLGPNNVDLGDRILVRVSIDYEPIVPLLNLPSFPLTATSARTIIKDVPVGLAPTAVSSASCAATTLTITDPTDGSSIVVGEKISPLVQVEVDDGSQPQGTIEVTVPDAAPVVFCDSIDVPNDDPFDSNCPAVFDVPVSSPGNSIEVIFIPDDPDAQCGANASINVPVVKADTTLAIEQITPMPYLTNRTVNVGLKFGALSPGVFIPDSGTGTITVTATSGTSSFNCTVNTSTLSSPDGSGQYTASCSLGSSNNFVRGETYMVTASYSGSTGYNTAASGSIPYVIPLEPTDPPTEEPTEEPTQPPTDPTPDPNCPYFASQVFTFPTNNKTVFWVNIINPNAYNFDLTQVKVSWPNDGAPLPLLMSTYFDPSTSQLDPCQNSTCLWEHQNQNQSLPPGNVVLSSSGPGKWNNAKAKILKGETKQMLLTYTVNLTGSGNYGLELYFKSGSTICIVEMDRPR